MWSFANIKLRNRGKFYTLDPWGETTAELRQILHGCRRMYESHQAVFTECWHTSQVHTAIGALLRNVIGCIFSACSTSPSFLLIKSRTFVQTFNMALDCFLSNIIIITTIIIIIIILIFLSNSDIVILGRVWESCLFCFHSISICSGTSRIWRLFGINISTIAIYSREESE